jgi:hypothetical protein
MNKFELSLHVIERMKIGGVPEEIIFKVLENSDKIESENKGQLIYQKIVLFDALKQYLVRVFVNSDETPDLVKTVYRISKLSKYL